MSKLVNEIIEVGTTRWLVREARSREDALDEIAHARVTGSVASKSMLSRGLGREDEVFADVVQINSDGTERKPYTEVY